MEEASVFKNKLPEPTVKKIKIGLGTFGSGKGPSDKKYINFLKAAIKIGITNIDTAEVYGNGRAEKLVGESIKGFKRKKLFITTKVWETNLKYGDAINSAKNSLKRLNTEYIDLYLIHRPNPKISLKETIKAMDFLVKKKMVRHMGVSNFSLKLLKEAQSYTKNKIVVNQVEYNLLKRKPEEGLLDYCQKNDILLVAYRPLMKGLLIKRGFKILDNLSKKYNKTQAQISLNWLISKENVAVIPRTISISHLKDNLGAIGWKLSNEDYNKLDKYFKRLWYIYKFFVKHILAIIGIVNGCIRVLHRRKKCK